MSARHPNPSLSSNTIGTSLIASEQAAMHTLNFAGILQWCILSLRKKV